MVGGCIKLLFKRSPLTTAFAYSTYSSPRSTDQPGAGLFATARPCRRLSRIILVSRWRSGSAASSRKPLLWSRT